VSKLLDKLRKKIKIEGGSMGSSNWPSVLVPQAPVEPDERKDKMTGLPYAMQAGGAFEDTEDRIGLASGWAEALRLVGRATRGRGAPSLASDIRPTTKFKIDDDIKDILTELRFRNKDNFIDPYDPSYSTTHLKINNEAEFEKYLLDNENIDLKHFNTLPLEERETLIDIFNVTKSDIKSADDLLGYKRDNVEYHTVPDERYTIAKGEKKSQLLAKLNTELDSVPVEDIEIAKRYADNIPKIDTTTSSPTMTKEEFLEGSIEKEPQYNASFFGNTKHVARLSTKIPRELGLHVGKKGHAETMYIRGSVPRGENIIEEAGIDYYMSFPDVVDEIDAKVLTNNKGVPDELMDTLVQEMSEVNPTIKKIGGTEPILQKGYINVKTPFVLNTDMINWNPSKIFGGFDPEGALKLDEQADILIRALESQTKIPEARAKIIVDKLAEDINSLVAKKDLIEKEGFVGDVYEHSMNVLTREAMQDLGFDSIKYKNIGELARVSEKQAGGHSYILFRDDQFATDFAKDAPFMRQPRTLRKTIPEVQKAYDDLKAGTITSDEYDKIVNNTVYPYEKVPPPETDEAMFKALAEPKRKNLNTPFEEGQEVGLRLDIPAYLSKENSAWVPTIHVNGKPKGHQSTAAIRDVDFTKSVSKKYSTAELAQGVMEGKEKSPFAQMMGKYIDRDAKQNYDAAVEALDSDEWIQVGFDPRRHSFFYDRVTGQPVATAEEVIQVGPLVLAKKATYADRSLYPYATGGKVLRSLGRKQYSLGGKIKNALAKLIGRGPEQQINTFIESVNLNNELVDKGLLGANQRLKYAEWEMTKDKEGSPVPVKDERGYKVPARFLTEEEVRNFDRANIAMGISGNEEAFNAIQHALLGYDNAGLTAPLIQGREILSARKQIELGNDPRTEHVDRWNNSFGINARRRGIPREEFKYTNIVNSLADVDGQGTDSKGRNNIPLQRGVDLIKNIKDVPSDFISRNLEGSTAGTGISMPPRDQINTGGKILGSLHRNCT